MENPLVSVVLPAYNAVTTIEESIQSILNQTYKNWELILINDGSKDMTEDVILKYTDPRIRYIENEGNKGRRGKCPWIVPLPPNQIS